MIKKVNHEIDHAGVCNITMHMCNYSSAQITSLQVGALFYCIFFMDVPWKSRFNRLLIWCTPETVSLFYHAEKL